MLLVGDLASQNDPPNVKCSFVVLNPASQMYLTEKIHVISASARHEI